MTIRIVGTEESAELNETYRSKKGPTNVLSFPWGDHDEDHRLLLGDIVICDAVVLTEAAEQQKSPEAHYAHLVTHGLLHLLGYDHENDADAEVMEGLETKLMLTLGYPDPWVEAELQETRHG